MDKTLNFLNEIRLLLPKKTIWLYTGYLYEEIDVNIDWDNDDRHWQKRRDILYSCDILVDGKYMDSRKDISLHWRGSSNQRVISVQESLKQNKIILHCD